MNYFSILNLNLKANLDLKSLESAYVKTQIEEFHNSSKQQLLNEAYSYLINPIKRIEHIFNIINYKFDESQTKELLLEFFEINELVSETSNKNELTKIADHLNQEIIDIMQKIDQLLELNSDKELSILFTRMKFINRILELIDKRGQIL